MMDTATENVPQDAAGETEPPFSPGKVLREAREKLGMSVADVASRIKFAPRQIEALEAEEFDHLPEPAFLRGFVRSYARLLQLDAAPLIAALPAAAPQPVAARIVDAPFPSAETARRPTMIWLAAALGVAVLLVLFVFFGGDGEEAAEPEVQPQALETRTVEQPVDLVIEAASAPLAESQVAAASQLGAQSAVASQSAVAAALPKASAVTPAPAPQKTPAVAAAQPRTPVTPAVIQPKSAVVAPAAAVKLPQAAIAQKASAVSAATAAAKAPASAVAATTASSPVHLVFKDDSLVEVKDSRGRVLANQKSLRGSQLWLNGQAPFSVSVSKAKAVRLYYRGKEIDLAQHANGDAARLKLE